MTSLTTKGTLRLYACGGGGLNIGQRFEKCRSVDELGFASIDTVYIDTSRSNLRPAIPDANVYLLGGLDGSGQVRAENHQQISTATRDILQQHQPGDLNVVLSTGAGGSGSVIAPSLVSELVDLEQPVVVVLIGAADTRKAVENTLKTLKSYDAIAKKRGRPIVVAYLQNSKDLPRPEVDRKIENLINSLSVLFSRQNLELDSKDLFNWLRYDRVTSFPVGVASLTMVDQSSSLDGLGNVITVATLATDTEETAFPIMPEYQCVGFVPEGVNQNVIEHVPVHFVTSDGLLVEAASQLDATLKELEQAQRSRLRTTSISSNSDSATDDGLVL